MPTGLKLRAEEPADLEVVSAAVQDAVFTVKDAQWRKAARRFTIALQRYRWEAMDAAGKGERVPAVLAMEGVLSVKARKVALGRPQAVASILALQFEPAAEPPGGVLVVSLAGGGEIAVEVECVELVLGDIGEVREALARPDHDNTPD